MQVLSDKQTEKALQTQEILLKIKPFSELGRKLFAQLKPFKAKQSTECLNYYHKIENLVYIINKSADFITVLGNYLSHFQWILKTIEESRSRTLEVFELFEVKHFIYFYQKVSDLLHSKALNEIIEIRDFSQLFDILDKDGQKVPSFCMSKNYSINFQNLHDKLSEIQSKRDQEIDYIKKNIINSLHLRDFYDKVTISRLNIKEIERFNQCSDLVIETENFANTTYKLKKNQRISEFEEEIIQIKQQIFEEETIIRKSLTLEISKNSEALKSAFEEISFLDVVFAKAIYAINHQCFIPHTISDNSIEISQGRNLTLQDEIKSLQLSYVPVSLNFKEETIVLTGANMAGKTSLLKMLGQMLSLLAYGIPLPCKDCKLPLVDFIFYSGPITQEHRADLSSFAHEIVGIQQVLEKKGKGLILIDEFARGTNPEEGEALSQSLIQYFSKHSQGMFVTATHFTPPITNNTQHFRLSGLSEEDFIELRNLSYTYLKENLKEIHTRFSFELVEVEQGSVPPKSALNIAELLGFESEIIEEAKNIQKRIL